MKTKSLLITLGFLAAVSGWTQPMHYKNGSGLDFQPPRNVEAVRIYKLTEALALTDDQIKTFIPMLQVHEKGIRTEQKALADLVDQGRNMLNQDKLDQKNVNKFMDQVLSQQDKIQKMNREFFKSLAKYLTPRQQLQYLGFEQHFRRQLRNFIRDQRGPQTRPGGPMMDGKGMRRKADLREFPGPEPGLIFPK